MTDERTIYVAGFTDAQQPIVRRIVCELQPCGVALQATFTHQRRHICIGGTAQSLDKLESTLRVYACDVATPPRDRRLARNAAEHVSMRLRDERESVMKKRGIYAASKTRHAEKWKALRAQGVLIISTWIDEAGPGDTPSFSDLWLRCVREASSADFVLLYHEPGDELKGAFVEVGCALASGVPVRVVGDPPGSFVHHPLVTRYATIEEAVRA